MRILLSNDDGYFAPGLAALAEALAGLGELTVVAPERDETADVDAILARVSDRTRLVFLANPNNPTGTYLPFSEVKRLHAGLPKTVLLV